jgi:hypothetical protein
MFEFSVETLRLPRGLEMLNLKSLKAQVSFSNFADEQEPLKAKLIVPLSWGMLNLSEGVNDWRDCACEKRQKQENTKATMMTVVSPIWTDVPWDPVKGATVLNVSWLAKAISLFNLSVHG